MNKKRSVIALTALIFVMALMPVSQVDAASRPKMSIEQLRQTFPNDSFWASPTGDPMQVSNIKPSASGGSVIPNRGFDGGENCGGFAWLMFELYHGVDTTNYNGPDHIEFNNAMYPNIFDKLEAGDIVTIVTQDLLHHDFFVYGKSQDRLYTIEANVQDLSKGDVNGDNRIMWDNWMYTREFINSLPAVGAWRLPKGASATQPTTPQQPTQSQSTTTTPTPAPTGKGSDMHRMFNPGSGEHFYTASTTERDVIVKAGWKYEGIGWNAPATGDPVYRLFSGTDHHYTTSSGERDALVKAGWKYEGIGWYSGGSTPLYRLYNPNAKTGSHHYTISTTERDHLVKAGWKYEGIGWYSN